VTPEERKKESDRVQAWDDLESEINRLHLQAERIKWENAYNLRFDTQVRVQEQAAYITAIKQVMQQQIADLKKKQKEL
jgi:gamma-glutamyl:cysteine ligase YbdK (ATP-grasp superfamily)